MHISQITITYMQFFRDKIVSVNFQMALNDLESCSLCPPAPERILKCKGLCYRDIKSYFLFSIYPDQRSWGRRRNGLIRLSVPSFGRPPYGRPSRFWGFCWDFSWWRHQMETFSAFLAFVWGIHRSLVNSPHKGQWRGALMFFFYLRLN